jgi:hypothetical protein
MKITLHAAVLIAAAIALALLADAWRSARHDSAQLTATLATQKTTIQQAEEREKQRDAQLSTAIAAIAAQKIKVQTPQQAATAIPSVLPPLPLPISIHLPDLSASSKSKEELPASVSIPQADLKPLYDEIQDCRATEMESDATKKDLADEKTQIAALLRERDVAVAAAHGGAFWVRLKRDIKWFAIGIAVGVSAKEAHR